MAGFRSVGTEKVGVDRGIDHSRFAIIVSADPARNIMTYSDIAVRAVRSRAVPSGQARHHRPHDPTGDRAHPFRSEIGVELVPRVAHRRQAIADVLRAPWFDDRLDAAVADADDDVIVIEVELLD